MIVEPGIRRFPRNRPSNRSRPNRISGIATIAESPERRRTRLRRGRNPRFAINLFDRCFVRLVERLLARLNKVYARGDRRTLDLEITFGDDDRPERSTYAGIGK
jgi:hypothetical protein